MKKFIAVLSLITVSLFSYAQLSQKKILLDEMARRPADPWPRSEGHVVLAIPGSLEQEKAYLEPGGGFSPAFGTFGISLWVTDKSNGRFYSADDMEYQKFTQFFTSGENTAIITKSSEFETTHKINDSYDYSISVKNMSGGKKDLSLMIRSVGPTGGPINKLVLKGNNLIINESWIVSITPAPEYVSMGDETLDGWTNLITPSRSIELANGWGFARIGLGAKDYTFRVFKTEIPYKPPIVYNNIYSSLSIELPDERFEQSLNSQVAHLMMSLVRDECRPGDPNNYPLPWLRDGAYILTALARAGQVDVAKQLALYLAKNDFFGGFGPEADAPGLSIWGIMQVAYEAQDPAFNNEIWPHIKRKVQFIERMINAREPIRIPITNIIVNETRQNPDSNLVCEASKDGLIIGRMDWHRPVTYVNSVSYSGLKHAAILAEMLNQPEAGKWKKMAGDLRKSWIKNFDTYWDNERTYICSFWTDWIAYPIKSKYLEKAEGYWKSSHDSAGNYLENPLWTYFNISDAHQWLLLQKPEKTWHTLEWFWNNQTSPGLYTWWEGSGGGSGSQKIRGWFKGKPITPHYWTAAEVLALQLDMLAYIDESGKEPVLVIGEGIKKDWLTEPIKIEGLRLHGTQLNWYWDGNKLTVHLNGKKMKVVAGSVFDPKTEIMVNIEKPRSFKQ